MRDLVANHPRLWISVAVGSLIYFLLPGDWSTLNRVLVGWNCGVTLFLCLLFVWMMGLTAEQICTKYLEEDESGPIILVVVTLAALLSLVAIVEPLATMKNAVGAARAARFALAAMTLVNSWALVPAMFTTHYADCFYSAKEEDRPLRFPETPMPIFWDFAYFAYTIAAACQTADVTTLEAGVRKWVLAQTLISFLFNASILGFAINVTAGLIGSS
ncbi:MAG: DUF1345 domain-containing protein [Gammaproteobacteria bacterium]